MSLTLKPGAMFEWLEAIGVKLGVSFSLSASATVNLCTGDWAIGRVTGTIRAWAEWEIDTWFGKVQFRKSWESPALVIAEGFKGNTKELKLFDCDDKCDCCPKKDGDTTPDVSCPRRTYAPSV